MKKPLENEQADKAARDAAVVTLMRLIKKR